MEPDFWGCLGDGNSDRDYRLGGLVLPIPRNTFETAGHIQYDQSKKRNPSSTKACTIFSAMGCISDLTGHVFTEDEIEELLRTGIAKGFNVNSGWMSRLAMDHVIKHYSEVYEPLMYFRLNMKEPEFMEALEKGYTAQVSYRGNGDYGKDFRDDGELDGVDFPNPTYGHAIRTIYQDATLRMVDNYFKLSNKTNTYTVSKERLDKLMANGVFYSYAYVACYKKDFDEANTQVIVPLYLTKAYEAAKKAGLKLENIDDVVANAETEDMFLKLGIFNTKMGSVTRGRMWEFLRRVGKI